jgi:hypothetical protein
VVELLHIRHHPIQPVVKIRFGLAVSGNKVDNSYRLAVQAFGHIGVPPKVSLDQD